jgi:hypothetical protein
MTQYKATADHLLMKLVLGNCMEGVEKKEEPQDKAL